MLKIKYLWYR